MNTLSLRQLRYFEALARHLHFAKAAQECAISQPALSMQVQEMERELGISLIERTRQGARLTPEGQEIARRVRRILADIKELGSFARHHNRLLSGPLTLGVIPTIAPYILPKLLPLMLKRYPDLDLHLKETQTHHLLNDLMAAKLDVALLALPVDHLDVETLPLFQDVFKLVVPGSRPLPPGQLATPDFFKNEHLLLLEEGHCLRNQALNVCEPHQAGNINTFGTSSLSTLVQMVSHGFGVTLLPQMSLRIEAEQKPVQVLSFAEPEPFRTIGLAWRASSSRKADFVAFGELLMTLSK